MHSKPFKKVVEKLKAIRPDMIMITGDYINDHGKNKEKMFEIGKELLSLSPVYYITGNNERRMDDFDVLMKELSDLGFTVLLNDISKGIINGNRITVLGLDENQASFEDYKARKKGTFVYKNMQPYFDKLEKSSGFKIVLSHFPENFETVKENNYSQYNFELQLSGHAHGGQFRLPLIGGLVAPNQGLFPKYDAGLYTDGGTNMVVSRGLGNSIIPIRFNNRPEIVLVELSSRNS